MRNLFRVVTIVLATAALVLGLTAIAGSEDSPRNVAEVELGSLPAESVSAPPECPESWRAIRLKCKPGAEGIAVGNYGGSDFFLTCDEEVRTCTSGNTWRYLMEGASPDGPIVRCALSGESDQVNEFCGPLHLIIN